MKNIRHSLLAGIAVLLAALPGETQAQKKADAVTQTYQVSGNCGMCKKTIEKAAKKAGAKKSSWHVKNKQLTVTYDSAETNANAILKSVAYAGYDNEKYLAPEEAYNSLHSCCKYERTRPGAKAAEQTGGNPAAKTAAAGNEKQEPGTEAVYGAYFTLKDALVKSDAEGAKSGSAALLQAMEKVNMAALDQQEHEVYMKQSDRIKTEAALISKTGDLEKQRKSFSKLSGHVYTLMKTIRPSYPVFIAHCPMYDGGRGADWISKESGIQNPYYGSAMMTCGKVKETIR